MANLMSRRRGDRATLRVEYRFGLVLLLLLATFAFLMVGSTSQWARPVSVALTGATLVAALYASEVSRRWRRLATVIAVIALLAAFSIVAVRGAGANGTAAVLDAALVVVAPIAIARSVARRGTIDVETVLAALCIYVIFGLLWGFIYNAIGNFASSPFFAQPITPSE